MKYTLAFIALVIGELIAAVVFHLLKKSLGPEETGEETGNSRRGSVLKGMLERITILTGLVAGFQIVLVAFTTLKIGTRLSGDQGNHISNRYFLTGNLLSILFTMIYAVIIKHLGISI